jgi:hypothetical protein
MSQWQARATLENGAIVMFGMEADSDSDALDLLHLRLADAGQRIEGAEVWPLLRSRER